MAGHNKWSKIKRKKAGNDARRSKIWARITRDIMVAAREGGGDPEMNAALGLAVEKAKAENMPKDNIERAIKRGTGEIEGQDYEETTYEGYGPGGVAIFVECLTDNTNRTIADMRSTFSKLGGSLGNSGSVAYLFEQKAVFEVPARGVDEDELFLAVADAGAEDLDREGDAFVVRAPVDAFGSVQRAIEEAGFEMREAELRRIAVTTTTPDAAALPTLLKLLGRLEDHQDVQAVYSTLEADEAVLAAYA